MSLATRCTHCGTIFKVVQDQLKVSEGWVRCGRCNEVFNALPALFDLEKDPPPPRVAPPAPEPAPEPQATPGPDAAPDFSAAPSHQAEWQVPAQPGFAAAPAPEEPAVPPSAWAPPAPVALPEEAQPISQDLISGDEINPALQTAVQPQPAFIADGPAPFSTDTPSQPPAFWESTQPLPLPDGAADAPVPDRPLVEDDLALDPAPIEGTTEFELDTSLPVDDNSPLPPEGYFPAPRPAPAPQPANVRQEPSYQAQPEAYARALEPAYHAAPAPIAPPAFTLEPAPPAQEGDLQFNESPRPWLDAPPEDVPSTDEADALDSRYLMPTSRERKAPRRGRGPEFADAQFPTDAMEDAEEDWASDFGVSALEPEPASPEPAQRYEPAPAAPVANRLQPATKQAEPFAQASVSSPAQADEAEDDIPTTQPSRFTDDFTPEAPSSLPPSLRKGKPGTRGADPAQQTPQFLKHAQRKAFWRHPATRAALSVLLLSLVLTLGLQLMHQFRDLLAASNQETRPLLTQWCGLVGCKLAPPLRLEDLQVESATLVRATSEGPDNYRLTVVVHNKAPIDLAWPHVDLTLSDDNGAVMARRVFAPRDAQWFNSADTRADAATAGAHASSSAASSAASTPTAAPKGRSTTLQWRLQARGIHPAGYTAELFYP